MPSGRKSNPNPTAVQLRNRRYYARNKGLFKQRYLDRKSGLIEPEIDGEDRMHLIDVPIQKTSIGWEHISSGRSNS